MPVRQSEGAERIRYYIHGIIREHHEESVRIPSSYDLAERFGTTRRVAQYELERLIESGLLIGKHRVGTFTNPNSAFFWHASNGEPQPFVGVTYGSGDYFTYSYTASLSIAAIYRQLAESGCMLHDLRLLRKTPETIFEEIAPLHLDALVWAVKNNDNTLNLSLLRRLIDAEIPVVTFGLLFPGEVSGVAPSCDGAMRKLTLICRQENRMRILIQYPQSTLLPEMDKYFPEKEFELKQITRGPLPENFNTAEELLKSGFRPGLWICEDGFIPAVERLCAQYGMDPRRECRIVSLYAYRPAHEFNGYSIHPDFERMAENAAELIQRHLSAEKYTPETIRVEGSLIEWINGKRKKME